jgi:PD-(D/E)XK nuclease superfamily
MWMFYETFANELQVIGLEFERLLQNALADSAEDLPFEDPPAVETLLQSVRMAKREGRWRRAQFDLFEVLGLTRRELSHSSFLAWLLDPAESHGLGDAFLRQFMMSAAGEEPPSTVDLTVSLELHSGDGRFDICVKGDSWCLVVENKIDATLSIGQRVRYQAYCDRLKGRDQQAWLVYVTPGVRPPVEHWLSYREIRRILERILESWPVPHAPRMTIEHFCEHIFAHLEA